MKENLSSLKFTHCVCLLSQRAVSLAFSEKQYYLIHSFSSCPPFTSCTSGHLHVRYVGLLSPNTPKAAKALLYPFFKWCSFLLFAVMAAPRGSQGFSRLNLPWKNFFLTGETCRWSISPHPQIQQLVTGPELPGELGLGRDTGHAACCVLGRSVVFWKVYK